VGKFAPSKTYLTPFLVNAFASAKSISFSVADGKAISPFKFHGFSFG
jgi:hypothetical protein